MKLVLNSHLKQLLKRKDMTVAQLSRATAIPPQTLNNWLSGQEPRKLSQVKIVADYFGVSLDELLYKIEIPEQRKINTDIREFSEEINAGIFEVVLRRVKK